jgi:RNA polymerase sigma-70 factor (ECF subfamily)
MRPTTNSETTSQEASGLDYEASIEACARGDHAALRALFEEDAGRLIGVARRIVRRHDLAEEVVQDAFVQIWRHAGRYDPQLGSARGWVYTIVRNLALNVVRDSAREHLFSDHELHALKDQDQIIDDAFHRLANNSRLRFCLEQLDDKKRRSLLLGYVAGFSHGEIAGKLGVPLGTAKSWVRRAVAALRECLS